MPITYACDHCHATATSLDNWRIVSVQFLRVDPGTPTPPGGRTLEATLPDHVFDTENCRSEWLGKAGLATPTHA